MTVLWGDLHVSAEHPGDLSVAEIRGVQPHIPVGSRGVDDAGDVTLGVGRTRVVSRGHGADIDEVQAIGASGIHLVLTVSVFHVSNNSQGKTHRDVLDDVENAHATLRIGYGGEAGDDDADIGTDRANLVGRCTDIAQVGVANSIVVSDVVTGASPRRAVVVHSNGDDDGTGTGVEITSSDCSVNPSEHGSGGQSVTGPIGNGSSGFLSEFARPVVVRLLAVAGKRSTRPNELGELLSKEVARLVGVGAIAIANGDDVSGRRGHRGGCCGQSHGGGKSGH